MIYLRDIKLVHIEKMRIHRNKLKQFFRQEQDISFQDQLDWFIAYKKQFKKKNPDTVLFSIIEDKNLIGCCGFTSIDYKNKKAEVSFYLFDSYIDNRIEKALDILIDSAFKNLGLVRVYTDVFMFDNKKMEFLKSYGFRIEGILKDNYYKNNQFISSVVFALLK
jgi:RimJ/RimL family protein N-acetyltransferase